MIRNAPQPEPTRIEKLITWVGSVSSLVLHTIVFIVFFWLSWSGILSWQLMLLFLTTAVSLEAIYLAIFIQMTVNKSVKELQEVGEDIDELSEDIDEITEDLEEDDERDTLHWSQQDAAIDQLTSDVRRILADLETLKRTR